MKNAELQVVTASGLRLRDRPTTTSRVLAVLGRGESVRVLESSTDGAWRRVEHLVRGVPLRGWMASKYLAPVEHPAASTTARELPWVTAALYELGVAEISGALHEPRVLAYLASTNLDRELASRDETPWCSAFVNWCFEVTGHAGTDSAAARSWLGWGSRAAAPTRGCVTVLSRAGGGHVGFWVGQSASRVTLLGGNQGNRVCMADYDVARVLDHRVLA